MGYTCTRVGCRSANGSREHTRVRQGYCGHVCTCGKDVDRTHANSGWRDTSGVAALGNRRHQDVTSCLGTRVV